MEVLDIRPNLSKVLKKSQNELKSNLRGPTAEPSLRLTAMFVPMMTPYQVLSYVHTACACVSSLDGRAV